MPLAGDSGLSLHRVRMGPLDNNAYILADPATRSCYVVDAPCDPDDPDKLVHEIRGFTVKGIIITHNHWDHTVGLRQLREATGAPVGVHRDDKAALPEPPDLVLEDGDIMPLGKSVIRVIHTPGHTRGSVCLLVDKWLFSGDTLFSGGPGRTGSPQALRLEIRSIVGKLLVLDSDVTVYPGHGGDTTVAQAKKEYEVFSGRPRSQDLFGDVVWLTS